MAVNDEVGRPLEVGHIIVFAVPDNPKVRRGRIMSVESLTLDPTKPPINRVVVKALIEVVMPSQIGVIPGMFIIGKDDLTEEEKKTISLIKEA